MKKIFLLVVGLIIFSVTNFANAAHYWVTSETSTTNKKISYYVDSDGIGITYLEKVNNIEKLKFSKDKNKLASSNGYLFTVRYIEVTEWTESNQKKQKNEVKTCYFYRQIGEREVNFEGKWSMFNSSLPNFVIKKLTNGYKVEFADDYGKKGDLISGLRCLYFQKAAYINLYFDVLVRRYSYFNEYSPYYLYGMIYDKAREIFSAPDNTNENAKIEDIKINNHLENFCDYNLPITYCGDEILQSGEKLSYYLVNGSPFGNKNNFICLAKVVSSNDVKSQKSGSFYGLHFIKQENDTRCYLLPTYYGKYFSIFKYRFFYNLYNISVQQLK